MSTPSASASSPAGDSVTLRSTWHGLAFASLGVACLLGVAVAIVVSGGAGVISIVLLIAATGSALVVLFDMPISTRFDAEGVVRKTPLREHHIDWDDIDRLQRMRRGMVRPRVSSKGLVAMRGPRQVLLCDRTETRAQHDELRRVVGPELAEFYFTGLSRPSET